MYIEYCYGPKWPYLIYIAYIGLFGTGICRFVQVLYLGRAPRTKETLPDFLKWRRVTRPPLVFRGLTGSQRTPGFWGVTKTQVLPVSMLAEILQRNLMKCLASGAIIAIDHYIHERLAGRFIGNQQIGRVLMKAGSAVLLLHMGPNMSPLTKGRWINF